MEEREPSQNAPREEKRTPERHEKFLLIVTAVIRNAEGKILLQKRVDPDIPDADGAWELPGGKINPGETLQEAVIRECKEETGYTIELVRKLPRTQNHDWKMQDGSTLMTHVLCYEARPIGESERRPDKKVADVRWVPEDELDSFKLLRGIREFIEAARK